MTAGAAPPTRSGTLYRVPRGSCRHRRWTGTASAPCAIGDVMAPSCERMPTTAVIIIDAVNRGREFLEGTTLGGGTAMTLRTGRRAAVTLTSSCRTASGPGGSGQRKRPARTQTEQASPAPNFRTAPGHPRTRTAAGRDSRTAIFRRNSASSRPVAVGPCQGNSKQQEESRGAQRTRTQHISCI